MVRAAEKPILPQREFVSRDELSAAGYTAETLDVVHLRAGAHHEVVLAEAYAALGAFDPVQPEWTGPGMRREAHTQKKEREREGDFRQVLAQEGRDPGHKPDLPSKK